jgi:tetratricopeptide (TPR) repeat protein
MGKSSLVLLAISFLLLTMTTPLSAQNGYSIAGANAYLAKKDWPGLLAYTKGWTRVAPGDPMAWYYLGQTYGYGLNEPEQAVIAFRRAVSLREQWPEAWHALAFACVQSKQYGEAIKAARQAIAQAPNRPNYWNTLALAYSYLGDWNSTVQTLYEEQQHMAQATSYDWYNLGNAYSNAGHEQEAINAYNQSLRMNPRFGDAWNNLGIAEQMVGNDTEAMADYKRASQLGDPVSAENFTKLQQSIAAARAAATQQSSANPGQGVYRCVPWVNTPANSTCGSTGHSPCPHPLTVCSWTK